MIKSMSVSPYKTSKKTWPTEIIGLASLEKAIKHLRSVTFNYEDGDKSFNMTAHKYEYASAVKALNAEIA
jgi:hypothetical protein